MINVKGARRPHAVGLYVGAAVLFWLHNDEKARIGLVQTIIPIDTDVVETVDGKDRMWNGVWPRLDILAISPIDGEQGEPVMVTAIPHEDDVADNLALEGVPGSFLWSCPRYVFVKELKGIS